MRFIARKLWFAPSDTINRLRFGKQQLCPPRSLIYTGGGDFIKLGRRTFQLIQHHVEVKQDAQILDVGSGIGRVAIPFTEYLNSAGNYQGFDVVKIGVDWCKKHISSKFPNFQFQFVPLDNDLYNSKGNHTGYYKFPYADAQFDLVILNSVFTHLLPEITENYLQEIHRVLKPGGACYGTFFLIGDDYQAEKKPDFTFKHRYAGYAFMDDKVKSANVAYELPFLEQISGTLKIEKVQHGYWYSNEKNSENEFQDIVIFRK